MTQDSAMLVYSRVAKVGDVAPGSAVQVEIGELSVALFNLDGEFYATEGYCTHAFAALAEGSVNGEQIECPLHFACFSIKTGKVLSEPATEDLKTYPVRVENGEIFVGVPE
jgi:nitrite reductase/ring-hydroxylating ferredoxin subunit